MEKKSIKYGGFIALGLITYFLLVQLLGLHENPWLCLLNGAIVAFGIYKVIKDMKAESDANFNFFDGFKAETIS